jgi:hypothetical protein
VILGARSTILSNITIGQNVTVVGVDKIKEKISK